LKAKIKKMNYGRKVYGLFSADSYDTAHFAFKRPGAGAAVNVCKSCWQCDVGGSCRAEAQTFLPDP
jgi:hypothetical protein